MELPTCTLIHSTTDGTIKEEILDLSTYMYLIVVRDSFLRGASDATIKFVMAISSYRVLHRGGNPAFLKIR